MIFKKTLFFCFLMPSLLKAACIFDVTLPNSSELITEPSTTREPVRISGIRWPNEPDEATNKHYVDSFLSSLESDYVVSDKKILSIDFPSPLDVISKNQHLRVKDGTGFSKPMSDLILLDSFYLVPPTLSNTSVTTKLDDSVSIQVVHSFNTPDDIYMGVRYRNSDALSFTRDNFSGWNDISSTHFQSELIKVGNFEITRQTFPSSTAGTQASMSLVSIFNVPHNVTGTFVKEIKIKSPILVKNVKIYGHSISTDQGGLSLVAVKDSQPASVLFGYNKLRAFSLLDFGTFRVSGNIIADPHFPHVGIYPVTPNFPLILDSRDTNVRFGGRDLYRPSYLCGGNIANCSVSANPTLGKGFRIDDAKNAVTTLGTDLIFDYAGSLPSAQQTITFHGTATDINMIETAQFVFKDPKAVETFLGGYQGELTLDPKGSNPGHVFFNGPATHAGSMLVGKLPNQMQIDFENAAIVKLPSTSPLEFKAFSGIVNQKSHSHNLQMLQIGSKYPLTLTGGAKANIKSATALMLISENGILDAQNARYSGLKSLKTGHLIMKDDKITLDPSVVLPAVIKVDSKRPVRALSALKKISKVILTKGSEKITISPGSIKTDSAIIFASATIVKLNGGKVIQVPSYTGKDITNNYLVNRDDFHKSITASFDKRKAGADVKFNNVVGTELRSDVNDTKTSLYRTKNAHDAITQEAISLNTNHEGKPETLTYAWYAWVSRTPHYGSYSRKLGSPLLVYGSKYAHRPAEERKKYDTIPYFAMSEDVQITGTCISQTSKSDFSVTGGSNVLAQTQFTNTCNKRISENRTPFILAWTSSGKVDSSFISYPEVWVPPTTKTGDTPFMFADQTHRMVRTLDETLFDNSYCIPDGGCFIGADFYRHPIAIPFVMKSISFGYRFFLARKAPGKRETSSVLAAQYIASQVTPAAGPGDAGYDGFVTPFYGFFAAQSGVRIVYFKNDENFWFAQNISYGNPIEPDRMHGLSDIDLYSFGFADTIWDDYALFFKVQGGNVYNNSGRLKFAATLTCMTC